MRFRNINAIKLEQDPKNKLFAVVSLKSHWAQTEAVEFGVGYRFSQDEKRNIFDVFYSISSL